MIVSILYFVIILGIIVFVHEFGHFFFAKLFGIYVYEFSLGMGPKIFSKKGKKGETVYSIRAIPIGGYVAMANGDMADILIEEDDIISLKLEDDSVTEIILDESIDEYDVKGKVIRTELKGEHGEPLEIELEIDGENKTYPVLKDAFFVSSPKDRIQITPYERTMDSKPIWQRFIVLFAGGFMNFVTALLICIMCSFVSGTPNTSSNQIGETLDTGKAYAAGIIVIAVNGKSVSSWNEFTKEMEKPTLTSDNKISITYKHDNVENTISLTPDIYIYNVGITNIGVTA